MNEEDIMKVLEQQIQAKLDAYNAQTPTAQDKGLTDRLIDNKNNFNEAKNQMSGAKSQMAELEQIARDREAKLIRGEMGARIPSSNIAAGINNFTANKQQYLDDFGERLQLAKDTMEAGEQQKGQDFDELMKLLGYRNDISQQGFDNQIKLRELGITEKKPTNEQAQEGDTSPNGQWEYQGGDWRPVGGDQVLTGSQAYAIASRDPGMKRYLDNVARNGEQRNAVAADILYHWGSVEAWRQDTSLPATDLMIDEDKKKWDVLAEFKQGADWANQYFQDESGSGILNGLGDMLQGKTGPWASKLGGFRGEEAKQAQASIEMFSSDKVKELSGAAVSDAEMERLRAFLPSAKDQESVVASKLSNLKKWINLQQDVREMAARSGQDINTIYEQNKDMLYEKYGFDGGKSQPQPTAPNTPDINNQILDDLGI